MKQIITIDELWCDAIIGIYPRERETRQPLMLTVIVEIDAAAAIAEDSITQTLDYDALCSALMQHAQQHSYNLLETLLHHLLQEIGRFDDALAAEIRITKPKALEQIGATVAVSGRWQRER